MEVKNQVVSETEGKVSKEHIKRVLLDIDPLVRKYFKNMIKFHTGIDTANTNELDLEASIHFLKHIWGMCLEWGNQRIKYIERSVRQLVEFLNSFHSKNEVHNFRIFSEKLENYLDIKPRTSIISNEVLRLTKLFTNFNSVRIKTATLIMRFICLDCNFFEVDKSKLIPPLDRVNYRMCEQLFGREHTRAKLGRMKGTFDEKATMTFDDIGKDILGENKVLIDNLWFIGHFYHDGSNCQIREGVKIVEFPYLQDISLPTSCPFSAYGCEKSFEATSFQRD